MNDLLTRDTDRWLSEHARHWVDSGLVSEEQARAIEALERHDRAVLAPEEPEVGEGLPLAVELMSYLGIVLVAISGIFVIGRSWNDLPVAGHLGIAVVIAMVGLIGGALVMRAGGRAAIRLGGFLWLGGTAGVALTTGVAVYEFWSDDPGVIALSVGLVVMLISAALWRNLDRPLQFLTTVGGLGVAVGASFAVFGLDLTPLQGGALVWMFAVALVALGAVEILQPRVFVVAVGGIGAIFGSQIMGEDHHLLLVFAAATAAGVLLVGLALKLTVITVIGVLGFLQALGTLLGVYMKGAVGGLVVMVLGIAIVAAALYVKLHGDGHGRPHAHA